MALSSPRKVPKKDITIETIFQSLILSNSLQLHPASITSAGLTTSAACTTDSTDHDNTTSATGITRPLPILTTSARRNTSHGYMIARALSRPNFNKPATPPFKKKFSLAAQVEPVTFEAKKSRKSVAQKSWRSAAASAQSATPISKRY